MYSRRVTNRAIYNASQRLGIRLRRYPLPYINRCVAHFDALLNADGSLIRPLDPDERAFIRNERIVCKLDFSYWATRYARIRHFSENRLIPFEPNVAQRILLDIFGEMEDEGIALFVQILKARQLGMSTAVELMMCHRTQFWANVRAVVASSRPEKSEEMTSMMEMCWANEPWWLVPRQTVARAGALIEFGDLVSSVSIQHGAQMTGIARGTTPTAVHLSELCEYNNPEELVDASLMRAIHQSPSTLFVMESTALGIGNWWHNTWLVSKEGWPTRTADFCPVFLPWFVGDDIYPDDTWLKAHPIPAGWTPSPLASAHRDRCNDYAHTNDILRRHLGDNWVLPDRQLWWWEVQRNIASKKKQLAQFYSETPSSDGEAFQATNVSVFDADVISQCRDHTRNPVAVFGFVGHPDEFPLSAQPDAREIDSSLPRIPVKARIHSLQTPVECDLVPIKFEGYSNLNEMGKLLLYEMPEDGEEYGIGVDTSEGLGQDRSVMEVLRRGTYSRNDAYVAEFASPRLNSLDLFPFTFVLGHFFSTPSAEGDLRRPRMVVECRWNGENVQVELQKKGWPNFHKWTRYHKTKYNLGQERNIGWYTNAWSRPMMMDYLIKSIRDGYLDINSPYMVEELATLELDEVGQSIKALHGRHDDRVMAGGIVYFSMHILELGEGRAMAPRARTKEQLHAVASGRPPMYVNPAQGRDWQDVSGRDIYEPNEEGRYE